MTIAGLTIRTGFQAPLSAAGEQVMFAPGEIVAARVVGPDDNGTTQVAIGRQVVSITLPEPLPAGTTLMLQAGNSGSASSFTVLAQVPPQEAGDAVLLLPQAAQQLQSLLPGGVETVTAEVAARMANGVTRLAVNGTVLDAILPQPLPVGEIVRFAVPDRVNPAILRLLPEMPESLRDAGTVQVVPRSLQTLARLALAPGATIAAKLVGSTAQGTSYIAIGENVLEVTLPQTLPNGTSLRLQAPADGNRTRLFLVGTTVPTESGPGRALAVASPSLATLQGLALKPGLQVEAQVVAQLPSGESEIMLGGQKLTVTLPEGRPIGAFLSLRVEGTEASPKLVLNPPSQETQPALPPTSLAGLRQAALAGQGSLGSVFESLARSDTSGGVLPRAITSAATPLLQSTLMLDGDAPSATDIRQAIVQSGIFLESGRSAGTADIKGALMSLRGALAKWIGGEVNPLAVALSARKPTPPVRGGVPRAHLVPLPEGGEATDAKALGHTMLADTEAALHRTRLMQLASLPDANAQSQISQKQPLFTTEVPLRLASELCMAQFQVARDGGGQQGSEAPTDRGWQMRFAVNYSILGEVGAQITLRGKRVSVSLWAERPETADVLETMLPELRPGLAARGIEPVALNCRVGRPAEAVALPSGSYLDATK